MLTNAKLGTLRAAARAAAVRINVRKVGKRLRFTLRPIKRWYRWGPHRRVAAVCWHGHYVFLAELFRREPEAWVRAGVVSIANPGPWGVQYNGLADFLEKADKTFNTPRRIDGINYWFGDLCECAHNGGNRDWTRYLAVRKRAHDCRGSAA